MEIRFREFRKADVDALFFLDQNCFPPVQQSAFSTLLDVLLHPDATAMVAEEIGEGYQRVIGGLIVRCEASRSRLHIVSLTVNEEFRRLGIARHLLEWAERLARSSKCNLLLVPLHYGNTAGEALLSASGFRIAGDEWEEEPAAAYRQLWRREVVHEVQA
ncbi:MAG: GNAT family N-acetyltransferase [SAR324 cluster bacterium]|nr:GNAT family N-acetyltransferase [SAR324 cluster bacterium]